MIELHDTESSLSPLKPDDASMSSKIKWRALIGLAHPFGASKESEDCV